MKVLSSYQRIVLYQKIPGLLVSWIGKFRSRRSCAEIPCIENIDRFLTGEPKGHILMILAPDAWLRAVQEHPHIRMFNIDGLTWEVVKAFNTKGYSVDIINCLSADIDLPQKKYSLVFAHGGNCKRIIEALPPTTPVLHYASGAYWEKFNQMSEERYANFSKRTNIPLASRFTRSLTGTEDGEDYLARRADFTFLSGPRTVATFAGISKKMSLLYLGSYIDHDMRVPEKDFETGRKNFIYVAGTNGNIQKGMDLLIETFSRTPDLHLYIYCKVEESILQAYRKELSLGNIHYVYHLKLPVFRKKLLELFSRINFTVSAPIDTGPGTALIGSIGLGFIPVGYIDIEGSSEDSCLVDDYRIETLVGAVKEASSRDSAWCSRASELNIRKYEKLHEPDSFGKNFLEYLSSTGL